MKVVILGADGFVGKNLFIDLTSLFECYGSTRRKEYLNLKNRFFFDIADTESWVEVIKIKPDCIINSIGYGVVKDQTSVADMLNVNYLETTRFYDYLSANLPGVYLMHLGTAFEYDLNYSALPESSACVPKTYYGISKYMASNFLLNNKKINHYTIVRPFNMFGPYEDVSKIIPKLILAQLERKPVALSDGLQKRDYFFVKDLSSMLGLLIKNPSFRKNKVLNVGSGKPIQIKELANLLVPYLKNFNPDYWKWGNLSYREGESVSFYNGSEMAFNYGLQLTDINEAMEITVKYYENV